MMIRAQAADQRQSVGQIDLVLNEDSAMPRSNIAVFGNILVFEQFIASLPANRNVMPVANAQIRITVNGSVNHPLIPGARPAIALVDAQRIVAIDIELRAAPVPVALMA